jgi:hypothetical protein
MTVRINPTFLANQVTSAEDDSDDRTKRDDDDAGEVDQFADNEDDVLGFERFHAPGYPLSSTILSEGHDRRTGTHHVP